MLENNEFAVKVDDPFITFLRVSLSKALLLIPAFFLTLIAVVHIQQHPLKTLAAILVIALFAKALWVRLTRKIHFQIDFSDNTFKFYDHKKNLYWHFLQDVEEVSWKSRFVGEYVNPLKNTCQKHEITIRLKMKNEKLLTVFCFESDYPEPSREIMELYSLLESSICRIKPLTKAI
jgi:predicted membrane protein